MHIRYRTAVYIVNRRLSSGRTYSLEAIEAEAGGRTLAVVQGRTYSLEAIEAEAGGRTLAVVQGRTQLEGIEAGAGGRALAVVQGRTQLGGDSRRSRRQKIGSGSGADIKLRGDSRRSRWSWRQNNGGCISLNVARIKKQQQTNVFLFIYYSFCLFFSLIGNFSFYLQRIRWKITNDGFWKKKTLIQIMQQINYQKNVKLMNLLDYFDSYQSWGEFQAPQIKGS